MRNEIRNYNVQVIQQALTNGRRLKAAQLNIKEGKSLIAAIRNKDGSITINRDKLIERCAEFYKELYSSTTDRPNPPTTDDEPIPEILDCEVLHAMRQMADNKAPGKDGIVIDTMNLGGPVICKHMVKLFNNCLSKRKTPEVWNNATVILLQ